MSKVKVLIETRSGEIKNIVANGDIDIHFANYDELDKFGNEAFNSSLLNPRNESNGIEVVTNEIFDNSYRSLEQ